MPNTSPDPNNLAAARQPWRRVFVIITAFLFLFLCSLAWMIHRGSKSRSGWFADARQMTDTSTERNALTFLVQAFEKTDWQALEAMETRLRERAVSGWAVRDMELLALLEQHQSAIVAVSMATEVRESRFPSTESAGLLGPRPDLQALTRFTWLLSANARRLEADGRTEEALWRALDLMNFGALFTRPTAEASLSGHLAGLAALELGLTIAKPILVDAQLPAITRQRAALRLALIEAEYNSARNAIVAEGLLFAREAEARVGNPRQLRLLLEYFGHQTDEQQAAALAEPYRADPSLLVADVEQLLRRMLEAANNKRRDGVRIDRAWFDANAPHPLLAHQFTDVSSLLVREDVMLAKLRLARWACSILSPAGEQTVPEDPFGGEPLRQRGDTIYSIGPDLEDGGGESVYTPSQGTRSEGDVLLKLPVEP